MTFPVFFPSERGPRSPKPPSFGQKKVRERERKKRRRRGVQRERERERKQPKKKKTEQKVLKRERMDNETKGCTISLAPVPLARKMFFSFI